jgi:hypothetical protein
VAGSVQQSQVTQLIASAVNHCNDVVDVGIALA